MCIAILSASIVLIERVGANRSTTQFTQDRLSCSIAYPLGLRTIAVLSQFCRHSCDAAALAVLERTVPASNGARTGSSELERNPSQIDWFASGHQPRRHAVTGMAARTPPLLSHAHLPHGAGA